MIQIKLIEEVGLVSKQQLQDECMDENCCKDKLEKLECCNGKDFGKCCRNEIGICCTDKTNCCKEKIQTNAIKQLLSNTGCKPLRRIEVVLHAYSLLLRDVDRTEWPSKIRISDFFIGKYGHEQLCNDFHHVNRYHIVVDNDAIVARDRMQDEEMRYYFGIAKNLCEYFEGKEETYDSIEDVQNLSCHCKYGERVQDCLSFTRHYRERSNQIGERAIMTIEREKADQKLYVDKEQILNDELQPELAKETNNEIALQQECDKLHCFFLQLISNYSIPYLNI